MGGGQKVAEETGHPAWQVGGQDQGFGSCAEAADISQRTAEQVRVMKWLRLLMLTYIYACSLIV